MDYQYPETEDLKPTQNRFRLFAWDVSANCHFRDKPAGVARVEVIEIRAMSARTPVAHYCSPVPQQATYLLRHEVTCYDAAGEPIFEGDPYDWSGEQEIDFNCHPDNVRAWDLHGRNTFSKCPFVDVVVDIDEDKYDELCAEPWDDKDRMLDIAWFDVLADNEGANTTLVPRPTPNPAPTGASES